MQKNDETAGVLARKCPKLRTVDYWEEGAGNVEGAGAWAWR